MAHRKKKSKGKVSHPGLAEIDKMLREITVKVMSRVDADDVPKFKGFFQRRDQWRAVIMKILEKRS